MLRANSTWYGACRSGYLGKAPMAGPHHTPGRWTRGERVPTVKAGPGPVPPITFQPHSAIPKWPERPRHPYPAEWGAGHGSGGLSQTSLGGTQRPGAGRQHYGPHCPQPQADLTISSLKPQAADQLPQASPQVHPKSRQDLWAAVFSGRECVMRRKKQWEEHRAL